MVLLTLCLLFNIDIVCLPKRFIVRWISKRTDNGRSHSGTTFYASRKVFFCFFLFEKIKTRTTKKKTNKFENFHFINSVRDIHRHIVSMENDGKWKSWTNSNKRRMRKQKKKNEENHMWTIPLATLVDLLDILYKYPEE